MSFLFHFLQEWNTPELRQAPNFIERQLQIMLRFQRSGPLPSAHPPALHLPSPPAAGPSKPRNISGLLKVKALSKPKPNPPRPNPPQPTQPKPIEPKLVIGLGRQNPLGSQVRV